MNRADDGPCDRVKLLKGAVSGGIIGRMPATDKTNLSRHLQIGEILKQILAWPRAENFHF
jgi:hypothetical protein